MRVAWRWTVAAWLVVATSAQGGEHDFRLLEFDGYPVKWGDHKLGTGANVSYGFADRSMHFSDARNCRELVPLDGLAERFDMSMDEIHRETAAAFRSWEQAANITFRQVDAAHDADIIIGAQKRPRGRAYANVTYHPGAENGVKTIDQSLVCLNPEHAWKIGFDGDTDVYDLRYTLTHEIGHAIGLDHPGASGQLMGFRYNEEYSDLQPGDLSGVGQLYGRTTDSMAAGDTSD